MHQEKSFMTPVTHTVCCALCFFSHHAHVEWKRERERDWGREESTFSLLRCPFYEIRTYHHHHSSHKIWFLRWSICTLISACIWLVEVERQLHTAAGERITIYTKPLPVYQTHTHECSFHSPLLFSFLRFVPFTIKYRLYVPMCIASIPRYAQATLFSWFCLCIYTHTLRWVQDYSGKTWYNGSYNEATQRTIRSYEDFVFLWFGNVKLFIICCSRSCFLSKKTFDYE